jgi:ATP-binding cassette, subfamily B, bacterial
MSVEQAHSRIGRYWRFDIYRQVLPYIRPYTLGMVVVVALTLLGSLIGLLDPWPMKLLIDSGLSGKPIPAWLDSVPFVSANGATGVIVVAVLAILVLTVIQRVVNLAEDYLETRINYKMTLRFRADLFTHLQRLSFSFHDRNPVADSVYRVQEDTGFINTLIWANFRNTLTSVITFGGMLFILLRLNWQLALLALISIPIHFATISRSSNRFRKRSKDVKAMQSRNQTIVQEVLSLLRVVKAFGQEEREQRRYVESASKTVRASLRLMLLEDSVGIALGTVTAINRGLILLVGALDVLHGSLTLGELVVILAYVDNLYWPLEMIGEVLTNMQLSLASAERVMEVLDLEPDITDRPGAVQLDRVAGAVELRNVDFAYPGGGQVLHDISLAAEPGEVVAIVGPTGAGKTTLANMIVRFYDPTAGNVLLDGHDLRDVTVSTLRRSMALVIQEPLLFTGSIRENIAYGRPDAEMERIEAAAAAANADAFIKGLPDGYDTEVGQRGMLLSGGERQRIAIARAFLMDAPILILDEPTSSVDSRTEASILDALDRLIQGRTTFVIAHRLSTIRHAGQILVIDGGRIVERGVHDELLTNDGLYAEFHRIQTFGLRGRGSRRVARQPRSSTA